MVNILFSIPGYAHLYRSLLRFYEKPVGEIKEVLYYLNLSNLDSYKYHHPQAYVAESGPVRFCGALDRLTCRPYRTEVQLYKAILALKCGIDYRYISSSERESVQALNCILSCIEYRFYKTYGMEIEDVRTVFSECVYHLVPKENEPSVCLRHEWEYLPSA